MHRGQRDGQDRAGVSRVDDAVVPESTGGVLRRRLLLYLRLRGGPQLLIGRFVERSPGRFSRVLPRTIDRTPASCLGPMTAMR